MKKITLALCILCTFIFSSAQANQQRRKVLLWSFAENNCEEWKRRKDDIDKKFNIDLQIELFGQNTFIQRLQAVMADGEGAPDIIEWLIENNRILSSDPEKSFVIPLNKYISKSMINNKILNSRLSWVTYSNNIYGLQHDVHPTVLVYNDTVWKRAGVDISKIETWDEFFEESKKLQKLKRNGQQVHFALPFGFGGLGDSMFMIWQQTGSQIITNDGKPNINSPEFIEFVRKWEEWMNTGSMVFWDFAKFSDCVEDGTYASFIATDWLLSYAITAAEKGKYTFKMRSLPAYKKESKYTSSWNESYLSIPKGTKDPDRIFEIMNYMLYDESVLIGKYNEESIIPPVKSLWNHDIFNETNSKIGNEKTAQIQIQSAKNMPVIIVGDLFWDIINDFNEQYSLYFTDGDISFDEMIENAQHNAMQRLDPQYNKIDEVETEQDIEEDVYDE